MSFIIVHKDILFNYFEILANILEIHSWANLLSNFRFDWKAHYDGYVFWYG